MIDDLRRIVGEVVATRHAPVTVALDGPSGAGKSTIARALAIATAGVLVPSDDFFAAQLTRVEWDARSPMERARDAIDWSRLRRCAIEPLRAGKRAVWHPFDFGAGERDDGSYAMATHVEQREPAPVIIIDGAYSARPELADLLDLTVLVDAPESVRHARLEAREEAAFLQAWHQRWDDAERYYFGQVRPIESFDLVVDVITGSVQDRRRTGPLAPLPTNGL